MNRNPYPSDLTDSHWAVLEPWISPPRPGGRPRKTNMREVVNAILYLTREGCSWRALPHDYPPWKTVYNYFEQWKRDGTWDRLLDILRWRVRQKAGRDPDPRVACIDSQSVKTAHGGAEVGTDGGKKVRGRKVNNRRSRSAGQGSVAIIGLPTSRNGLGEYLRRKRHIVVDTMGLLLAVVVTAANVDDARAAQELFAQLPGANFGRLEVVQADAKYNSPELERWLRVHHRAYRIWVVSRPPGEHRFVPLRSRWVVERTFAWLGRYRRLSKDYEQLPESSEAMLKIAGIHHYLRRLCPNRMVRSQRFRFQGHLPKLAA